MRPYGSFCPFLLFGYLLFTAFHGAHAQTFIEGKVIDDSTGSPIQHANVRVKGTPRGCESGPKGGFELELPPEKDSLIVSHTAYKERAVHARGKEGLKVRLAPQAQKMPGVVVAGQKGIDRNFTKLSKLDVPSFELPSAYDKVSRATIDGRQADELTDAMKNATGIRPINRYGGFQTFTVRGFNDFLVLTDGVRDERHNLSSSAPSSNLAGVDHIEVLKGPASALYGHSALGGVINVVRNRPTEEFRSHFSVSAGSFERKRIKAGAGGPLSENLNYRIDAGLSDKKGWRGFSQNRAHAYMALNYKPSQKDKLALQGSVSKDRYNTDSGIPTVDGKVPSDMDLSTRYNDPQDFTRFEQYNFQLRYTHQFSEDLKISEQFSYVHDDIENNQGEALSLTEDRDSVKRSFYLHFNHLTTPIHNRLELSYETSTGPVKHRLLAGYSLGMLDRSTYMGFAFGSPIATVSMKDPQNAQGYVNVDFTEVQRKKERFHGFYLRDHIVPLPSLKFLLSVRYDLFKGRYRTDRTDHRRVIERGSVSKKRSGNTSVKAGAVYTITEGLNFFASYSDHYEPSRTINRENEVLDPVSGHQYEGGFKWIPFDGLRTHLTGFRIRKKNMIAEIGKGRYEQVNSAVSQGAELDISGKLAPWLRLSGGYAYTLARIEEYSEEASGELEGNRLRFSPEHMAHFWATYSPSNGAFQGFSLSAGGNYFGKAYTDRANEISLPAYYVIDASLAYSFGKSELRFSVKNLTDETYFSSAIYGDQFFPGPPRNYFVSFSHSL